MTNPPTFNPTPLTSVIGEFALSIGAYQGTDFLISGTATFIAPYLAITAKHVVEHYWREFKRTEMKTNESKNRLDLKGNFNIIGVQTLENGQKGALWTVQQIYISAATDIAYINLIPFSNEAKNYKWRFPRLEMLPPKVGSRIHAFGYRNSSASADGNNVEWRIEGTTSMGDVKEVHNLRRDNFSINFPCIHTNARFDGGMSGGPVFNSDGKIFAIISSNLPPTEEGEDHASYAALIWPSMNTMINLNRQGIDFAGFYPILELCRGNIVAADNHERVGLEYNEHGENIQVTIAIPK